MAAQCLQEAVVGGKGDTLRYGVHAIRGDLQYLLAAFFLAYGSEQILLGIDLYRHLNACGVCPVLENLRDHFPANGGDILFGRVGDRALHTFADHGKSNAYCGNDCGVLRDLMVNAVGLCQIRHDHRAATASADKAALAEIDLIGSRHLVYRCHDLFRGQAQRLVGSFLDRTAHRPRKRLPGRPCRLRIGVSVILGTHTSGYDRRSGERKCIAFLPADNAGIVAVARLRSDA